VYCCQCYLACKSKIFCAAFIFTSVVSGLPYYIIHSMIFEKKLLNIKCVLRFTMQLLSETLLSLWWIQIDIAIKLHRFSCEVPSIVGRFYLHLNFRQTFEKYLNQISRKAVQWKPSCSVWAVRRTVARHVEANCRFTQSWRTWLQTERPSALIPIFNRFVCFFLRFSLVTSQCPNPLTV
jgi:hypothetical protein